MKKIMMIGCGAMGGAILSGCLSKGLWTKEEVYIKASTEKSTVEKAERYGVSAASLKDIGEADFVLLAVKPDIIPFILEEINPYRPRRVISVAAAVTAATLEAGLPEKTPVIRVMPNTPASVGGGMTAITAGRYADEDFIETAKEIFSALGKAAVVSERQLDEMGALSGAGPGYVFVIIDALADAGVRAGLPRKLAVEAAAQTLYGAAKMVLETGKHPAELRDGVTSPGGTTIAGIHAMEARGIRAALMDAVMAALAKSDEMSRK